MTAIFYKKEAEAFAERLVRILNDGAIALAMSVGHRTWLFDVMEHLPHSTSQEIAETAGLNERYVREWLAIMVTSSFINYDREAKTYYLPPEHSAFLTRTANANNFATLAQYISQLGNVEDEIVESFHNGGGVPYSHFQRFQQIMAEDSGQNLVFYLIESVLPLVPGIVPNLEKGILVLDVACGSGKALNKMAKAFPRSQFIGYDLSPQGISFAQKEAKQQQLTNIQFEVKDAATIDDIEKYDFITTFNAICDLAHPDLVLENIYQALRPQGFYLMQDINAQTDLGDNLHHPLAPLLYTISCMHSMTVSLAEGGAGLGTMWGQEKALAMLQKAGFATVEIKQLERDIISNYYVIQKS